MTLTTIEKLKIMREKEPDKFLAYATKIKLENPSFYERLKAIFPELKEEIAEEEEPLDLKLSIEEKRHFNMGTILIIILILSFLIAGMYVFLMFR